MNQAGKYGPTIRFEDGHIMLTIGVEFLDMGLPAQDREKIASGNAIRVFNPGRAPSDGN